MSDMHSTIAWMSWKGAANYHCLGEHQAGPVICSDMSYEHHCFVTSGVFCARHRVYIFEEAAISRLAMLDRPINTAAVVAFTKLPLQR